MARQKQTGQKHTVRAEVRNLELVKAKSSLTLSIYGTQRKIGTLQVGRGSLIWRGRDRKRSKRLSWSQFAEMMSPPAKKAAPKKPPKKPTIADPTAERKGVDKIAAKPASKSATDRTAAEKFAADSLRANLAWATRRANGWVHPRTLAKAAAAKKGDAKG